MKDLDKLIEEGYITRRKHPSENLYILNYTPKTQYERVWNETTLACRGLIVDENNNIKARCFPKFFNYEEVRLEVEQLIQEGRKFHITEKIKLLYYVIIVGKKYD